MSASTPPMDLVTGWRYPCTQPSLPESHASIRVPRTGPFWRKALAFARPGIVGLDAWLLIGTAREWMT